MVPTIEKYLPADISTHVGHFRSSDIVGQIFATLVEQWAKRRTFVQFTNMHALRNWGVNYSRGLPPKS